MSKRRKNLIWDIVLIALAAIFALWVNRGIAIRGLYMDDLYMWSCYGEQSLREFIFPIGSSTRFRPVYWAATYLEMALIGTHVDRFVGFNIAVNVAAAVLIYYIIRRMVRAEAVGRIAGFISMILYLASRLSYYQIGQALGLMEAMALIMGLGILYELIRYAVLGGGRGSFVAALLIYFLAAFTHERYMALFPLFYIALILRHRSVSAELRNPLSGLPEVGVGFTGSLRSGCVFGDADPPTECPEVGVSFPGTDPDTPSPREPADRQIAEILSPLIVLLIIIAVRAYAIGAVIPAGTGGTTVTETFNIREALSYACDEVLYILGFSPGPEYLAGTDPSNIPADMRYMAITGAICILILCAAYVFAVIINTRSRAERSRDCGVASMVIGFIGLMIAASSVTVRLEMRWIYVSYAAALIYGSYMAGRAWELCREGRPSAHPLPGLPEVGVSFSARIPAHPPCAENLTRSPGTDPDTHTPRALGESPGGPARDEIREAGIGDGYGGRVGAHPSARPVIHPLLSYVAVAALICYGAVSLPLSIRYRGYFKNIYFWENQERMNSLYDETIGRYGRDGILGHDIYILGNTYEMTDFYAETFFKPYDPDKKAEGTHIIFIESLDEVPVSDVTDNGAKILTEVPAERAYRDITDEIG